MKKIYLIIVLVLLFKTTYSQNFIYKYDAAGNRIKRELPVIVKRAFASDTTKNESFKTIEEKADNQSSLFSNHDAFRTVLYPNPTFGIFTVELPDFKQGEKGYIFIYTEMGKMITQLKYINSTQIFDISNVPTGYYIVHIMVEGEVVTKKIIKQ